LNEIVSESGAPTKTSLPGVPLAGGASLSGICDLHEETLIITERCYVGLVLPAAKPQLTTGLRCLFSSSDGKVTGVEDSRADDRGGLSPRITRFFQLNCKIMGT